MSKRVLHCVVVLFWLLLTSVFSLPKASFAGVVNYYFHVGSKTYTVSGQNYTMDVAPFIKNGRVYVPIRYLINALGIPGSGVSWDPSTQTVTLTNGNITLAMTIGSTEPNWHLGQMPNGQNVSPQVDLTNEKAYIYPVQ